MVRSLWTSSNGMIAQQTAIDTISNNLANANSTAFKVETDNFKSLLYQGIRNLNEADTGNPPAEKAGLGVRSASVSKDFSQGAFINSDNPHSFAVAGKAFFAVQGNDGEVYYTRNGDFVFDSIDGVATLKTPEGLSVLSETGSVISLNESSFYGNLITYNSEGTLMHPSPGVSGPINPVYYADQAGNVIMYTDAWTGEQKPTPVQIGRYQFANRQGLKQVGNSLYAVTEASGDAINEFNNTDVEQSVLHNKYLEASNVNVAYEMVSMISSQRTYEMNSKGVQTSDEMMQAANQLKQ